MNVVDFLSELFEAGISYSGLNSARSALSVILTLDEGMTCGDHPLLKRFMRGAFHLRPSTPRYSYTWEVDKVLNYLETLSPLEDLTLKQLTLKLVTLIALITGQRCQSIHMMDLSHMQKTDNKYRFVIEGLIKTSKPGKVQPVLVLPKFDEDTNKCVFRTMDEYIDRTQNLRENSNKLFLSYTKPHNEVGKDTISRWIKKVLKLSGIDTNVFSSHSTRAASTSSAERATVSITTIMKAASWSNASTFRQFYNKPIQTEDEFALAILKCGSKN